MVRRSRPHLAAAALAAWLWSPLLLVATAIGAHNDAAMLVLLLLMLWLLQRRRWFPALLVLVLAAHVKLTVVIVTPVVGLWLVRRCGWRRTVGLSAAAVAVGLLFSWLLYAPFGGWGSLPRMLTERAAYLANSSWRVLYLHLSVQRGWPVEFVRRLTVQLPTALFAAGAVMVSLWMLDFRPRRWQAAPAPDWRDDRLLWRTMALVTLLYLLVGSFWFQHWYLVWVLAPAALLPDALLTRWLLPWLGFGALSANLVSAFAPALAPEPLSKIAVAALIVAVIWTPMLCASGWHLGRLRVRRHQGRRENGSNRGLARLGWRKYGRFGRGFNRAGEVMGGLAISNDKYVMHASREVRCLHSGLAQDGIAAFDIFPCRLRTKVSQAAEILLKELGNGGASRGVALDTEQGRVGMV